MAVRAKRRRAAPLQPLAPNVAVKPRRKRNAAATRVRSTVAEKGKRKMARSHDDDSNRPVGRPKKQAIVPDTPWFVGRFKQAGLTQTEVAKLLSKSGSGMSRQIKGERLPTLQDVVMLRRILRASSDELLMRFGFDVPAIGVPIAGRVTGKGEVTTVGTKGGMFEAPELPPNATAYIADTEGSPLSAYHGAAFIALESKGAGVPTSAFGRLCIVEADNELLPVLGTLGKARKRDSVSLQLFGSGLHRELKELHKVLVVHAILFS